MFLAITAFLVNVFGFDYEKARKIASIGLIVVILLIVLISGLWLRSCFNKPAKLDIKNIEKINSKNESERLKALSETVERNADVVKTVDGRNRISEQDEASKQAAIWAKVKEADEKIQAAKSIGKDVTGPELECILTGVCE